MINKTIFLLLSALTITSCAKNTPPNEAATEPAPATAPTINVPTSDKDLLLGVDVNGNGIRDSVEAYIDSIVLTDNQRSVTKYSAKVLQNTILIDTNDPAALQASSHQQMKYIACMALRFNSYEETTSILDLITLRTIDNEARAEAYKRYNTAQLGAATQIPVGNPCDNI